MAITLVKNADKLSVRFSNLANASQKAIARGTTKAAMMFQKRVRERIMKGPKSGRKYGNHVASAPGESPANQTGNLQRSVEMVAAKAEPNPTAKVVVKAPYAKALEYGTKRAGKGNSVTIKERPFMRPTMDELKDKMAEVIGDEIKKDTK